MFNEEEITLLFKGLDTLEKAAVQEYMMATMLGAGLIRDEEEKAEWFEKQETELEIQQEKQKLQSERIILLKAKLIGLRDAAEIENLDIADLSS